VVEDSVGEVEADVALLVDVVVLAVVVVAVECVAGSRWLSSPTALKVV